MLDDSETLRVYANPYAHLDHKGRAAGAVSCEAYTHVQPGDRRWVGAFPHPKQSRAKEREPGDLRGPQSETVFDFDMTKQTIPDSPHYRARIRERSLIAADKETAERGSVAFEEPSKALERCRANALHAWNAQYPKRTPLAMSASFSIGAPPASAAVEPAPPPQPAPTKAQPPDQPAPAAPAEAPKAGR